MSDFTDEELEEKVKEFSKKKYKWVHYKSDEQTTLWTCKVKGETYSKTVSIVNLSTEVLFEVFKRIDLILEYTPSVKSNKILEKFENGDIVFIHVPVGIPFVSNRYDIMRRLWEKNKNGFHHGVKSIDYPKSEKIKIKSSDLKMRNLTIRIIEKHFKSKKGEGEEEKEEEEEEEGESKGESGFSKITTYQTKCLNGSLPTKLVNLGLFKQPFKEVATWEKVAKQI